LGTTGGKLAGTEAKVTDHKPEGVTTPYDEIRGGNRPKHSQRQKKNRELGYNGLSKHTKQLHDKKARDGAAMREQTRNS